MLDLKYKKLKLFFVVLLFSLAASAKVNVEGYWITDSNDTVQAMFQIPIALKGHEPDFMILQGGIKYVDSSNQIVKLSPIHIRQIGFSYKGRLFKMNHRKTGLLTGYFWFRDLAFLQLVIDGKLKLYNCYGATGGEPVKSKSHSVIKSSGYDYPQAGYLIEREDGLLLDPNNCRGHLVTFKSKMIDFALQDCSELSYRINAEIFKSKDIEQIVVYYNKNCAAN